MGMWSCRDVRCETLNLKSFTGALILPSPIKCWTGAANVCFPCKAAGFTLRDAVQRADCSHCFYSWAGWTSGLMCWTCPPERRPMVGSRRAGDYTSHVWLDNSFSRWAAESSYGGLQHSDYCFSSISKQKNTLHFQIFCQKMTDRVNLKSLLQNYLLCLDMKQFIYQGWFMGWSLANKKQSDLNWKPEENQPKTKETKAGEQRTKTGLKTTWRSIFKYSWKLVGRETFLLQEEASVYAKIFQNISFHSVCLVWNLKTFQAVDLNSEYDQIIFLCRP